MPDFTLLSDQSVLLIQIAAALFVTAFLSFVYVTLTTILSLQKLKKVAGTDTDNLLVCDVAYFHCKGKRDNQEDSVYISPLEDSYSNGVIAACSDGMGGLLYGEVVYVRQLRERRKKRSLQSRQKGVSAILVNEVVRNIGNDSYSQEHDEFLQRRRQQHNPSA